MALQRLEPFIDGKTVAVAGKATTLVSPVDLSPAAELAEADAPLVLRATQSAHAAYLANRKASLAQRVQWLNAAAVLVEKAAPEITTMLIRDIGKPRRAASFEANRSAAFLRATAAEALGLRGETIPVDAAPTGAGRMGFTRRHPYGVVAGITPFNAPINLLIQKVAPALVAGNAIVVKPHPAGTRVALRVAQLFSESGLPDGLFNVLTGDRAPAAALVADERVMAVTFTGGTIAGDALARAAGAKKFLAELGSSAANIILADADIADAAKRIAAASFEASGQQCISAQRIIVEAPVYEAFLAAFVSASRALQVGDPEDEKTDVGPMVSMAAADRIMGMVEDARKRGARIALEPVRRDCIVSPAIIAGAPREASVWCDEAFGPLVTVESARDADHALAMANDSIFGLQGALFTRSLKQAMRFSEDFEVGSLWVNEASRFRLDMYPFGGAKRSGFGREGVRYAIEELSQLRFTGIRFDT
jgi:acyl-CoA reductase-like NAD-dependent aldehyde dehydrogenase